jgi:hypothetical protein
MYDLELPTRVLLEISDCIGLCRAFENRKELAIPMVQSVERAVIPNAASQPLTQHEKEDLKNIMARSRRLKRTFKGFQAVAKKLEGPPRGLEAIGLDRVEQSLEELRRLNVEWRLLIQDLDAALLKAARGIRIGSQKVGLQL